MRWTFLGGAESIGASCALFETGGTRWIVDCGIRLRGSGSERLPDLGLLESGQGPTAILVTHAHLDHIGALPVLHQRYPFARIHATPPTIDLTRVQLLDSLRIMAEDSAAEGELPLYTERMVEALLESMVPVRPLRPFRPDSGDAEVTFFPAGHIIGACSLGIETPEARVFVSGDISVDNQKTIPGMRPPRFRADVAVVESTYGKRLHPGRAGEEERLARRIAETVGEGGKVLVPAFAIGRAQEVLCVLLRAQLLEQIPRFPIHVDGMVRSACAIYSSHPWYLQSTLQKRIQKHGDPFFGVLETVRPVRSRDERARVIEGPPCVIISSSGMLTGGPSPLYARALLGDARNLIAITGYQDEEAPGRRLLEYADGRAETIAIDGAEVRPLCRVEKYALSGHASGPQIAALLAALRPADTLLVHGDAEARHELADLLLKERLGRIHLPRHGEPVDPAGRARGARARELRRLPGSGGGLFPPPGAADQGAREAGEVLAALAEHVWEMHGEAASFTADDLHRMAYGSAPPDDAASASFEEAVRGSLRFAPHPRKLFEFTVAPRVDAAGVPAYEDVHSLSRRLDEGLPRDAHLIRKSYQPGAPHMTLVFAFPSVARERHGAAIEEVFRGSGWTYDLHPLPNPTALESEIRKCIPDPTLLAGNASNRMEEMRATVRLARPLSDAEMPPWEAAAAEIRARTGFIIEYSVPAPSTPPAKEPRDLEGRLEINLAYGAIRKAFEDAPHRPYRVGRKALPGADAQLEAAFISPEVGERYRDKLDRLEREIGWRIAIAAVPNQNEILAEARKLLAGLEVRKGPSFVGLRREVQVSLATAPRPEEWSRLAAEFRERTGFELRMK